VLTSLSVAPGVALDWCQDFETYSGCDRLFVASRDGCDERRIQKVAGVKGTGAARDIPPGLPPSLASTTCLRIMAHPTPFYPSFDRSEVDRMLAKVKDTRLPDGPIIPGTSWDYGIDLAWLKDLKTTWETEWSYDALEKKMTSSVSLSSCLLVLDAWKLG
jgi:hypothetical protein